MATYIPHEVTDYVNPLKQYAQSAINNNEKALQDALAHSQQLYEADPGRDQLKTFKSLVNFSTTIASALQQKGEKNKKADEDLEKKTKGFMDLYLGSNEANKALNDAVFDQSSEEWKIHKDHKKVIKDLQKLEKYKGADPKFIDYVLKASPDEILRIQNYNASIDIAAQPRLIQENILKLSDEDKKNFHATHGKNGKSMQTYVVNNSVKLLKSKHGFNDEHIATHFIDPILKQAKTFGDGTTVRYQIEKQTDDTINFVNQIDTAAQGGNANELSAVTHLQLEKLSPLTNNGEDRDYDTGRKRLHSQLSLAIDKNGKITHNELKLMREGNNLGGVAAGKTGEVLLTPEQWDNLGKRLNARDALKQEVFDAETDQMKISLKAEFARPGAHNDQTREKSLLELTSRGVLPSSKEYQELAAMNLDAQTEAYYKEEKGKVDLLLQSGKVTDIKTLNIQNQKLFKETEKRLAIVKKFRNDNGYNKLNSDSASKDLIQGVTKPTLAKGTLNLQSVKGGALVQNYISQKRDAIIQAVALSETPTKSQVETLLRGELELDGFFVTPGNTEDINFGILTPDHEGNFPQFLAFKDADAELAPTGSDFEYTYKSVQQIHSGIEKLNIRGKTYTEKLVESGKGIDNAEIVALVRNLESGIKNPFPPDTALKATLFNVETSVLVKGKMQALIASNNPGDKQLVAAFNLNDWVNKVPTQDVDVRKIIEKGKDPNLLSYHKTLGIQNLSNNQLDRLIQLDKTIQIQPKINRAKKVWQQRKGTQELERLNNKYPGNNITAKDIKWDPEKKKWVLKKMASFRE